MGLKYVRIWFTSKKGIRMYNAGLFLHIIAAMIIAYLVLNGLFTSVFKLQSKQLRINMILLPLMSLLSLTSGYWIIETANFDHADLWITFSYCLLMALILINEVLLRRKLIKYRKRNAVSINVRTEYGLMTLITLGLIFLMVFKP